MRMISRISVLLLALSAILLLTNCGDNSTGTTPFGADPLLGTLPGDMGLDGRDGHDYDWFLTQSQNQSYTVYSQMIEGGLGGTLTVDGGDLSYIGYSEYFEIVVPPGAYTDNREIQIHIPNADGVPVYKLKVFPSVSSFNSEIEVTLDYSPFVGPGGFDNPRYVHHVAFMDTVREELVNTDSAFLADLHNPIVTFSTDHFSRWILTDPKDELEEGGGGGGLIH